MAIGPRFAADARQRELPREVSDSRRLWIARRAIDRIYTNMVSRTSKRGMTAVRFLNLPSMTFVSCWAPHARWHNLFKNHEWFDYWNDSFSPYAWQLFWEVTHFHAFTGPWRHHSNRVDDSCGSCWLSEPLHSTLTYVYTQRTRGSFFNFLTLRPPAASSAHPLQWRHNNLLSSRVNWKNDLALEIPPGTKWTFHLLVRSCTLL